MPYIINLAQQQEALKDIRNQLKLLREVNDFLTSCDGEGEFSICFTPAGSHKTLRSPIEAEHREQIKSMVLAHKREAVGKITQQAEAYSIALDADDAVVIH